MPMSGTGTTSSRKYIWILLIVAAIVVAAYYWYSQGYQKYGSVNTPAQNQEAAVKTPADDVTSIEKIGRASCRERV